MSNAESPAWLRNAILADLPRYGEVVLGSFAINVLALASMLFSIQVYDRVIPAQSLPTLWVLAIGVLIAVTFELFIRLARARLSDVVGRAADLRISARVFAHALRIKGSSRPRSTGALMSQVREIEQIRELIASTTMSIVADFPFFVLFLGVMWMIGGPLAIVPMMALPVLIIPSLIMQRRLRALSATTMKGVADRNTVLQESLSSIDDIKLLQAEAHFEDRWTKTNAAVADIALKLRTITSFLTNWGQQVQSVVYVCTLLVGAYLVMDGSMTTGTLVGASILASRMMAPIVPLSSVLAKWHQAKVAYESLNRLMALGTDEVEQSQKIQKPDLKGPIEINGLRFKHDPNGKRETVHIDQLTIPYGQRVAIMGRNAAGKSTLLSLIAGLNQPASGTIYIDEVNIQAIDTADLRQAMGVQQQGSTLFSGSIKENVLLGDPLATDEEILEALNLSGASSLIKNLPAGLGHEVGESGRALSGGQRQAVILARTLIKNPAFIIMDEPTAAMDEVAEREFVAAAEKATQGKTVLVATHRLAILNMVDRVIVMQEGKVALDVSRSQFIQRTIELQRKAKSAIEQNAPQKAQA